MRNDLLNILTHSNKNIDNQQLMAYVSDKLTEEEKRLFEEEMIDSNLLSDAVEGLSSMRDEDAIHGYASELNASLASYLAANKKRDNRRGVKDIPLVYLGIFIVVIIALLAFAIIYFQLFT